MKEILFASAAALCAVATAAHAADKEPRVFKPKGPWAADYGEDYCRLARTFTDGKDEISLGLDRIQPGLSMRMILAGDTLKTYHRATTLNYHYLPGGDDRQAPLLQSQTDNGTAFLIIYPAMMAPAPKLQNGRRAPPGPPRPYSREREQAFADGVDGIEITGGVVDPVELNTGGLKPVMAALQACTDDLVKYWGIDSEKQKTLTRPALPDGDSSKWLPQGTIGFGDFARLTGGVNQVRLLVDVEGNPSDCMVFYPTLAADTNKKMCDALMANAHFKPALDANGQPFASYFMTSPMFLAGSGFGGRGR